MFKKNGCLLSNSGNSLSDIYPNFAISIFDFELMPEEFDRLKALNRNEKHDWY